MFLFLLQSTRRAHRHNYEAAQQKLTSINQSLKVLKKRPNIETTDDININYSKFSQNAVNNNTINFSTLNNSNAKFASNNNLNNINNNIATTSTSERRNSTISNSSNSTQPQSMKSRSRCDSYGGHSSNGRISPTPSNLSGFYHHNNLADRIAFVTNAVSAAAAEAKNNANLMSPKHGRLRKPLTIDTSESNFYPMSAGSAGSHHILPRHSQQLPPPPPPHSYQSLHSHSPYLPPKSFQIQNSIGSKENRVPVPIEDDDDDDDITGQYATLLTLKTSPNNAKYQPQKPVMSPDDDDDEDDEDNDADPHYCVIESRKPKPSIEVSTLTHERHTMKVWNANDNGERTSYTLDNR